MRSLLSQKKYRLILSANFISLFGSGLNHAGIIWYVLQQTHSESALALLVAAITVPSLLFLPFTGLLIDRVDRRRLAIAIDVSRGAVVTAVAASAWTGHLQLWHIYAMGLLSGIGGFMYWPNLSALLQEMVEEHETVPVNAMLMAATQGGWMFAGALVGMIYGRLGLAGVLTIDALTYAVSAALYFRLRRGKHIGYRAGASFSPAAPEGEALGSPADGRRFFDELAAGLHYALNHNAVLIVGIATALFQAALLSQNVLTAPLNQIILRSGAIGYGLCNAGWSLGAMLASVAAVTVFRRGNHMRQTLWLALGLTGSACMVLPFSGALSAAMALYFLMGSGRALAGVCVGTILMQEVPREVMGRTQNLFTFAGVLLQLMMSFGAGWLAEHIHLAAGFFLVGGSYLAGSALASRLRSPARAFPEAEPETLIIGPEEL